MIAFRRRMVDHGAIAVQQISDILPLILLFAISVTGLMLTASYTWMKGYAYDFLAILHAVTVIFTLLYLPFGKFFHIFQRPAQLGVAFYKDQGRRSEQAKCARCGGEFASLMMVRDLAVVEKQLGFNNKQQIEAYGIDKFNELCRKTTSAENAARLLESRSVINVSHLLPLVKTPTLVLHSREDDVIPVSPNRQ